MPNYEKMYAVLCGAIDGVMDELARIPLASPAVERLHAALEQAEEIYIQTSVYTAERDDNIIELRVQRGKSGVKFISGRGQNLIG